MHILSVSEALQILSSHNGITLHAVKDILAKCNIPQNSTTIGRLNRNFTKVLNERLYARKKGNLDKWESDSERMEFCKYLPEADSNTDKLMKRIGVAFGEDDSSDNDADTQSHDFMRRSGEANTDDYEEEDQIAVESSLFSFSVL